MKTTLQKFLLLGAVASASAYRIDGGSEWEADDWFVQVDGVMGGKSTGSMEFLEDNQVLKFTGDISLDGGGFSSVRKRLSLDLTGYAGIVVTLEADARSLNEKTTPPIGIHLQLDDRTSRYDFSSAFSIPLSSEPTVTSVYLPVESFDRGTWIGFKCSNNCVFDPSEINGISVYVLFQEGSFDVRLRSIEAVTEPRAFPLPNYDVLESTQDILELLQSTISSGGGLYDKDYMELCIAMYWSVLNTILSSEIVTEPVKAVICAGLQEVETMMEQKDTKTNIAWTLRYAMDAIIQDVQQNPRTTVQDWLPTTSEAASMEVTCFGRTSAAPGFLYNPTNEYMLVSDAQQDIAAAEPPINSMNQDISNKKNEEPLSDSLEDEGNQGLDTAAIESNELNISGGIALFYSRLECIVFGVLLLGVVQLV